MSHIPEARGADTDAPDARRLPFVEFIALIAMLFATIAFSIDAMLPALPRIAKELSPETTNQAQLIITLFVLGMGIGTFLAGPLSDSFGRKPVIIAGVGLYVLGAALAYIAPNLETMIAARLLQGFGAAGPRVVVLAMVRDLYRGREMARIMSFVMMVFSVFPAIAPLLGSGIIALAGWRSIFLVFIVFAVAQALWLGLRQPETLPPAARHRLSVPELALALREVLGNRTVQITILVQAMVAGSLFATIASIQPVIDQTFGRGASFPLWFALIALVASSASLINASLVMRLGMRRMIASALSVQSVLSLAMLAATAAGLLPAGNLGFGVFVAWIITVFMLAGLTMGNLNALALEPVGHVAGMAASVVGSLSTIIASLLATPIGLAFNGTPLPLIAGIAVLVTVARLLSRLIPPAIPVTPPGR